MLRDTLLTKRLYLRPSTAADADRAFEILSDWEVARMLSMASFPPAREALAAWFGCHEHQWIAGEAFRFAVERDGKMIGLVDLDNVTHAHGTLGYWFKRSAWGQGFAFEAGQALVQFAFNELCLKRLSAGHAADNPASGRVLTKLGFGFVDKTQCYSKSRNQDVEQWNYQADKSFFASKL